MKKPCVVQFPDGQRYDISSRSRRWSEHFQRLLAAWHARRGMLVCCCRQVVRGERSLYVSKKGGTFAPRFIISKFPRTAGQHSPDCTYSSASKSGRDGYADGVINEREDGFTEIRLQELLSRSFVGDDRSKKAGTLGENSGQTAMTLRGLSDLLWERAELHTWHSGFRGKRSWGVVARRLSAIAQQILVRSTLLADRLLIVQSGSDANINFGKAVKRAVEEHHNLLIIGELQFLVVAADGSITGLQLNNFSATKLQFMDSNVVVAMQRSFHRELGALKLPNSRIIVILALQASLDNDKSSCHVVKISMRHMTKDFIPVDSQYEQQYADALIADGREFKKPLRYDCAEGMIADFIECRGAEPPIFVEIWGRNDGGYNARKERKIKAYRDNSERLHEWNALTEPLSLPPKEKGVRSTLYEALPELPSWASHYYQERSP